MSGVSGVGGSQNAQELQKQAQTQDVAAQQKLDQAALDANTAQQSDRQRELLGQQNGAQAMLAQMQAQQLGAQAGGPNAYDSATPEVKAKADAIAKQVMSALTSNMQSMMGQTTASQSAGGESTESNNGGGFSGNDRMGGTSSNQNAMMAEADQRVADAAKVAVYGDIQNLLKGMEARRQQKEKYGEMVDYYRQAAAGMKEGETKRVPIYQEDANGNFKKVGMKEMTKEEIQAEQAKWQDKKDTVSDMTQRDMIDLQSLNEKKSQLESLISNIIKSAGDSIQNAVGNLKA